MITAEFFSGFVLTSPTILLTRSRFKLKQNLIRVSKIFIENAKFYLTIKVETFGTLAMVESSCSAVGEFSCVSIHILPRNTQTGPFRDNVL